MKNILKKSILFLLVMCMLTSVLAACGTTEKTNNDDTKPQALQTDPNKESEPPVTEEKLDRVDLVFYLVGDPPQDMDKVEEKVNEILLDKINTTIDFQFSTWTDYEQKYRMTLFSGEADLIYSTNWIYYFDLARDGAFLDLAEVMDYMPDVKAAIPDGSWEQTKVNGAINMVPAVRKGWTPHVTAYRQDLCDKYNLPKPDSLENIEAYLKGVQENEPDQQLLAYDLAASSTAYWGCFGMGYYIPYSASWDEIKYGLVYDYNSPTELTNYWASDEFREHMKLMKKWQEMGFWSKNVLSATYEGTIETGAEVMHRCNPGQYVTLKANAEAYNSDWEIGYVLLPEVNGAAYPMHPTGDGTSIPASSKNPERAAMALNLILSNEELYRLISYGIQGEHYDIDENGTYVKLDANDKYPREGANTWNIRVPELSLPTESDIITNEISAKLDAIAAKTNTPYVNFVDGFSEDSSEYTAELAALLTVCAQYLTPIQAGLVDDVDAAIDEFLKKAEEAGLSKIQEGFSKQWIAYCEGLIG